MSRAKRDFLLLVLSLFLAGVVVVLVTPKAHAIDEVIDNYVDTSRVNVTDDMVHNATLDVMELNYTSDLGLKGWEYRKLHNITGSIGNNVTNYPVRIGVDYGDGVDSGSVVYVNGSSQTDFDDIRFTGSDGTTEIDYWLQEKIDGDSSIFWVEIPVILESPANTSFYIYYGNMAVTTSSDGNKTFTWFDHFDDNDYTTNYDIVKNAADTITEAGTTLTVTTSHVPAGHWTYLSKKTGLSINYLAFSVKVKRSSLGSGWEFLLDVGDSFNVDGSNLMQSKSTNVRRMQERDGGGGLVDNADDANLIDDTDYHIINHYYRYDTDAKGDYDGGTSLTNTFAAPREATPKIIFGQSAFTPAGANTVSIWDWLYVRKYVFPEPTHGGWGTEEAGGPGYESTGYFTTTNFLAGISYNATVGLFNSSIPGGTINLEWSPDAVTWTDLGLLTSGFWPEDLRALKSKRAILRFNFTRGGTQVTPRLYQTRLVYEGPGGGPCANVSGSWVDYNFTTIIALVGTNSSVGGNFVNQTYWLDGYQYNVTEPIGAPGYDIRFNITGLPDGLICLSLRNFMAYDGSAGHVFQVEAYNFTSSSWIFVADIPDSCCQWINGSVCWTPDDFIQGGEFWGRYYHPSPGNVNHEFILDYGKLRAFSPTPCPTPTPTPAGFSFIWALAIILLLFGLMIGSRMRR